ncbi:MAG: 16S rRNA (adenine(1518)-N(6)/adenine(1519)-N(6))-dimethyltransferase RsmA [Alphaproteobacteria bacterium]
MTENYYDNLPPISSFIEKYSLNALKSLGQNFILDLNLTDRIAKSIPNIKNSVIVEVGSGPAGLTRALLKNDTKKVIAIEFDTRAIGILKELQKVYPNKLEIIQSDALTVDFKKLKEQYAKDCDFRICSNLPYNISIPLTIKWIYDSDIIDSMTLMYQLEVGKRITAIPRTKDYGRISIISQLNYKTKILFEVKRTCFTPPPKVTSCIVSFTKLSSTLPLPLLKKIEEIVKLAFSQKRKMLRSTLKPLFNNDEDLKNTLNKIGIKETSRAEELTPTQFLKLAEII